MGFAAPLLFVCLGTSSRGNLHWAWGGWFCLFVYAVRVFSLFFFFFSRANRHQSSSHTVISRPKLMDTSVGLWWEKVVPPCFSISVCNFNFHSFTEAPLLSLLISSQRISGGQVIYIFCFHFPPDTSTRGREQSDALSHWAHPALLPTHQLGCERGPKEEGKWQGRLFH